MLHSLHSSSQATGLLRRSVRETRLPARFAGETLECRQQPCKLASQSARPTKRGRQRDVAERMPSDQTSNDSEHDEADSEALDDEDDLEATCSDSAAEDNSDGDDDDHPSSDQTPARGK